MTAVDGPGRPAVGSAAGSAAVTGCVEVGESVLPAAHRLRSAAEFRSVVRRGRRATRPLLTVHLLAAPHDAPAAGPGATAPGPAVGAPARAGLVVSKAVGGAVVRHRTSRRLRHLLAPHLSGPSADVPAGAGLVVRAAPSAGTASSAALGRDLDSALAALLRGVGPASPAAAPAPAPDQAGSATTSGSGS